MRKLLLICAGVLVISCNNKKKPGDRTATDKDSTAVTLNTAEANNQEGEMKSRVEELQKLTPLTIDELKTLIPPQILNVNASDIEAMKMGGLANFSAAQYKLTDSSNIKLTIFDCAGTLGAGYYNTNFYSMMNFEQDNDREYTKTVQFKGNNAIENCKKNRNECSFTYFSGDRFLVVLNGDNISIDTLKDIAKELKIK
jgi:hypothetical protein